MGGTRLWPNCVFRACANQLPTHTQLVLPDPLCAANHHPRNSSDTHVPEGAGKHGTLQFITGARLEGGGAQQQT